MLDTAAIGQAATAEHDADAFITRKVRAHFGAFDISNTEHRLAWTACVSAWKAAGGFVPTARVAQARDVLVPDHFTPELVWERAHLKRETYNAIAKDLGEHRSEVSRWARVLGFKASRRGIGEAPCSECFDVFDVSKGQRERLCEGCAERGVAA